MRGGAVKKLTDMEGNVTDPRALEEGCRVVGTARGARLEQDDAVLSEVLSRPGPTHGVFDLLAAAVAGLARGPRLAVLGFAAGGFVAPLRAMGWPGLVEGVDLSEKGPELFRRILGARAGAVHIDHDDAVTWLEKGGEWDVVVEDLSIPSATGVIKPPITIDPLPGLIRSNLTADGIVVTNLLPLLERSWQTLLEDLAGPGDSALVIHLDEYHNRILLTGRSLPGPDEAMRLLQGRLSAIGSRQAEKMSVRLLRQRS